MAARGVEFKFNDEICYRPAQWRLGSVVLFAGWSPMGIGWIAPVVVGRRTVLIVCGRVILGAARK